MAQPWPSTGVPRLPTLSLFRGPAAGQPRNYAPPLTSGGAPQLRWNCSRCSQLSTWSSLIHTARTSGRPRSRHRSTLHNDGAAPHTQPTGDRFFFLFLSGWAGASPASPSRNTPRSSPRSRGGGGEQSPLPYTGDAIHRPAPRGRTVRGVGRGEVGRGGNLTGTHPSIVPPLGRWTCPTGPRCSPSCRTRTQRTTCFPRASTSPHHK
jgi:hypothetical protein